MQNMINVYDDNGNQINSQTEKEYLVLLNYEDDSENTLEKTYEFINGREAVYEFLKNELTSNGLDPFNSYVIVETVTLNDRLTVLGFMKVCEKYFPDDAFSIYDLGYNDDAIAMYLAEDCVVSGDDINGSEKVNDMDVLSMNLLVNEDKEYDDDVEDV